MSEAAPLVALFAHARSTEPCEHLPLGMVYERIRTGAWATAVAAVRTLRAEVDVAADPATRADAERAWKAAKAALPAVTLSADAQTRARDTPWPTRGVQPSERLQVDLDLHGEPATTRATVYARLCASPHVEAAWRSPSGDGIKATVLVAGAGDPERHAEAFAAVDRWLWITVGRGNDPSVKDPQRLCFVSHDPDLYLNAAAVPLTLDPIAAEPIQRRDPLPMASDPAAISAPADGVIPSGSRNLTLARYAGWLRRCGLDADEIGAALSAINLRRCRPPLDPDEVRAIAGSIARYAPDPGSVAAVAAGAIALHAPLSIGQLLHLRPTLRPPLIHGILRRGETMNVIAAPKVGKSWLVTDLALAVATGCAWLGHPTERHDVLIIDNELHGETTAHRVPQVAAARGIAAADYHDHLFVEHLRGRLCDLFGMDAYFAAIPPGRYGVIVLDAFYRFLPAGTDENDNGTMASLYNTIDRHAERLACCFALIHHSSKGSQAGKAVTDVGAGAGAQSRATDTHLVLRPHEAPDAVVLDAAVRSWPPLRPQVLRWTFPVWNPAADLDPADLRRDRPRREPRPTSEPTPPPDPAAFVARFLTAQPQPRAAILTAALHAGLSQRTASLLLGAAEQAGLVVRSRGGANRPQGFAAVGDGVEQPHA